MEELFESIRESCDKTTWSKGVQLARAGSVTGEKQSNDEWILRVLNQDTGVSPTVTLWPSDEDWQCDCREKTDPCRHIAAAIIAIRRAQEQGETLPSAHSGGLKLGYRFKKTEEGLHFERVLISSSGEKKLNLPLTSLTTGRIAGETILATKEDLACEITLGNTRTGILTPKVLAKLCPALSGVDDIQLDGKAIEVGRDPTRLTLRITSEGSGVKLKALKDPHVIETFSNQLALCGGSEEKGILKFIQWPDLTQQELTSLRDGRFIPRTELARFVTEWLPNIRNHIDLDQRTPLPEVVRSRPRLEVHLQTEGQMLSVEAHISYGNPAIARVRGPYLELLGDEAPIRLIEEELKLKDRLSRELRLSLETPELLPPEEGLILTERIKNWNGEVTGDGAQDFRIFEALEPEFQVEDSGFQLTFTTDHQDTGDEEQSSGRHADAAAVLEAWQQGSGLVPLLEGGWAKLPEQWLASYGPRLMELMAARNKEREEQEDIKLPRACLPALASLAEDLDCALPTELGHLQQEIQGFSKIPDVSLPKGFNATLRSYQQLGVNWLSFVRSLKMGALLADDMGLGKTIQTITVIKGRTLIVAPTSVLPNWQNEMKKFRPDLDAKIWHGSSRSPTPQGQVTLTTYGLLRAEFDTLNEIEWDMVVLDEAQHIKNPASKVAKAAHELNGNFRVALTGTPVENSLEDLWSQYQFLNPGLLGSLSFFRKYCLRPIQEGDQAATMRLQQKIKPFLLRRLKSEVAKDLPARTDTILYADLDEQERETYEALMGSSQKDLMSQLQQGGNIMAALEALLRLRQACCHQGLLPGNQNNSSAKVRLLIETLRNTIPQGHKALIFSQWTSFLDLIESECEQEGFDWLRLDGQTKDRQSIVDQFQNENGPPLLLMSLKAGGVGLNLTRADHVYLMDPWWNPAAEDQAADRAHRIGQTRPVMVHRMVAMNTIEEKILLLQDKKRSLAAAGVGGAIGEKGLTKDDLMSLFN